ncbi:MAG: ATP-binding cassette domain-containing protein [Bacilli bacterium]|nr:ATP-binding cassette domain-containing protein [Bacilli bacterium]
MKIFKVINVSKKFGTDILFTNFSTSIYSNTIYSFIGPSGCGKTTTLKILNGFINPSSGIIEHSIKSIISTNSFLDIPFIEELNMEENLILAECDISNPIFSNLNITTLFDKKPNQLSSGETNRFLVARALAANSNITFLDEPFSHLDSKNASKVMSEIIRCSRSTTVILSMHNLDQAKSFSNVVYEMNNKQWIESYNNKLINDNPIVLQTNSRDEIHKDILQKYIKANRKSFSKSSIIFNIFISIFTCFSFSILTQYLLNQNALSGTFQLLMCKWLIYILTFVFIVNLLFHTKKDLSFKRKDAQIFKSINLNRQSYRYINKLYSIFSVSILFISTFVISLFTPILSCLLLFGKINLNLLRPFYSCNYFISIFLTELAISACIFIYNYIIFKKVRY